MMEQMSGYCYNLALFKIKDGDITGAVQSLMDSTALDNSNVSAFNLLGLCLYRVGKLEMAKYFFNTSISIVQEANPATEYLQEIESMINDTKKAYEEVLEKIQNKNYSGALSLLEKENFQSFNDLSMFHMLKSWIYTRDKQVENALEAATNAYLLDTGNAQLVEIIFDVLT